MSSKFSNKIITHKYTRSLTQHIIQIIAQQLIIYWLPFVDQTSDKKRIGGTLALRWWTGGQV